MKLKLSAIVIIFQLAFLANAQPFQAYRLKASTVFKNNIFKDGPDSLAQFQGPARMVSIGDSVLFLAICSSKICRVKADPKANAADKNIFLIVNCLSDSNIVNQTKI
jgi:hypothetical protein